MSFYTFNSSLHSGQKFGIELETVILTLLCESVTFNRHVSHSCEFTSMLMSSSSAQTFKLLMFDLEATAGARYESNTFM
jgi:hypothetical protein